MAMWRVRLRRTRLILLWWLRGSGCLGVSGKDVDGMGLEV